MTVNTLSMVGIYSSLRELLNEFTSLQGDSLGSLGFSLFTAAAGLESQTPYGVQRIFNFNPTGEYNQDRATFQWECNLYVRPRDSQAQACEKAGDVVTGWLKQFKNTQDGLLFCRSFRRDTLPPFNDPADRQVYCVRIIANMTAWPKLLTQYHVTT